MLGTDEQLMQIKEALAGAAIKVGTTNWVRIGDSKSFLSAESTHRGEAFGWLLPYLVGIVVPVVTALIAALVKP
jgi:hypothetical protein